jgi:adenylate kinase
MESGELVSDDIIIEMLKNRLNKDDIRGGYIMDGFPRTRNQAEALSAMTVNREIAVYLKVNEEVVVKRLLSRLTCESCGDIYSTESNPPKVEGICDECGGKLIQRTDDNEETIRKRIEVYKEQTEPAIDYYRQKGVLHEIDASQSIDDVYSSILGVIN